MPSLALLESDTQSHETTSTQATSEKCQPGLLRELAGCMDQLREGFRAKLDCYRAEPQFEELIAHSVVLSYTNSSVEASGQPMPFVVSQGLGGLASEGEDWEE